MEGAGKFVLTEIRIYFEGDDSLKRGFHAFFAELVTMARDKRIKVYFIAAEGTPARDFAIAIRSHPNAWNILLLDTDGPDTGNLSASLCAEQGWEKPHEESIFWMVEMMEAWFHADKDALETFYGNGFKRNALKANPKVEQISKKDLKDGLSAATRNTTKGDYYDNKTRDGPELLARIDPRRVREAAPNCRRLFDVVLAKLSS